MVITNAPSPVDMRSAFQLTKSFRTGLTPEPIDWSLKIVNSLWSKVHCVTPVCGRAQSIRPETTVAILKAVTSVQHHVPTLLPIGNGTTNTSTAWSNRDVSCRLSLNATARHKLKGTETVKANQGVQYEISIDGVPRTYRDRQDIALQTARFLKSRNPHSVVKLKDLKSGEETVVAFTSGQ